MKAEVSSPLAAAACVLLLALIGIACGTRRTALRTEGPGLRQLLTQAGRWLSTACAAGRRMTTAALRRASSSTSIASVIPKAFIVPNSRKRS